MSGEDFKAYSDEKKRSRNKNDDYCVSKLLKEIIKSKYEIIELLGKGSFGCVFKGICRNTKRNVALKII